MNILLERGVTLITRFLKKFYDILPKNNVIKRPEVGVFPLGRILLVISLLLLMTLLLFGFLFANFEDWSYFEGIYFTVVAFTTVGLGDFVPSKHKFEHNSHIAYRILNLLMIIIGVTLTYIVLNLIATVWKNALHSLAGSKKILKLFPCIKTTTERTLRGGSCNSQRRMPSRGSSILSFADDYLNSGSFAAIQTAIDRIRAKADEEDRKNEIKAVNTIEAILKGEYKKIQQRQGNDPPSKWRRAAAKARISAAKKKYGGVNNNARGSNAFNFESEIGSPVLTQKTPLNHNLDNIIETEICSPLSLQKTPHHNLNNIEARIVVVEEVAKCLSPIDFYEEVSKSSNIFSEDSSSLNARVSTTTQETQHSYIEILGSNSNM